MAPDIDIFPALYHKNALCNPFVPRPSLPSGLATGLSATTARPRVMMYLSLPLAFGGRERPVRTDLGAV